MRAASISRSSSTTRLSRGRDLSRVVAAGDGVRAISGPGKAGDRTHFGAPPQSAGRFVCQRFTRFCSEPISFEICISLSRGVSRSKSALATPVRSCAAGLRVASIIHGVYPRLPREATAERSRPRPTRGRHAADQLAHPSTCRLCGSAGALRIGRLRARGEWPRLRRLRPMMRWT